MPTYQDSVIVSRTDPEATSVLLATKMSEFAAITSPLSLRVRSNLPFGSYEEMIKQLSIAVEAGDRYSTMAKFLIADALNQGEEIYGESWAQVFGPDMTWDYKYVRRIMSLGRAIDPEIRSMKLSWYFYLLISNFPRGDQQRYINVALDNMAIYPKSWVKRTGQFINEEQIERVLNDCKDDNIRTSILDVLEHRTATWRTVRKWANGLAPIPEHEIVLGDEIERIKGKWMDQGLFLDVVNVLMKDVAQLAKDVAVGKVVLSKEVK